MREVLEVGLEFIGVTIEILMFPIVGAVLAVRGHTFDDVQLTLSGDGPGQAMVGTGRIRRAAVVPAIYHGPPTTPPS